MFDVGWIEFLFLGVLALVVVGPRELPQLIRTLGSLVRQGRRWYREAATTFHQLQREIDLTDAARAPADAPPRHWEMLPDHVRQHVIGAQTAAPAEPAREATDER